MYNLGVLLANQWDPPELDQARIWWEKAADAGVTKAIYNLGALLADRWDPPSWTRPAPGGRRPPMPRPPAPCTGPPKSTAGVRVVALPAMIVDVMKAHLVEFPAERNELVFRGPLGASLRRNNFHRSVHWSKIVVEAGLPAGFHFHDLRHTGNNLAAASGASTRELMYRMGHGSMRAALIYQHATSQRDREIADALQKLIEREPTAMWPVRGPRSSSGPSRKQISGPQEGSH
jgi:integrase